MAPIGQLPSKKSNSSKSFFARIIPKKAENENDNVNNLPSEANIAKTPKPKSEFMNKYACRDDRQRANSMNKLSERYKKLEVTEEKSVQTVKEPGRLTIMQQKIEDQEKEVLQALQEIKIKEAKLKREKDELKMKEEELRIREQRIKIKEEQLNLSNDNIKTTADNVPINMELIKEGLQETIKIEFFNAKKSNTKLNIVKIRATVENIIQVAIDNVDIDKDRFSKIGLLEQLKTDIFKKIDLLSKSPSEFNLNQLFPGKTMPQISKLTLK